MIKFLPKKVIAAIIIVLGYSKIFLKKYGITLFFILLSVFLLFQCLYYKNSAAIYKSRLQNKDQYSKQLEADIRILQESNQSKIYSEKKININPYSYIPDIPEAHRTHREYYYPTQPTYTPPPQTENYYKKSQEDYLQQQNKEIEERRIMELESKVNHYELERDMRLLNY